MDLIIRFFKHIFNRIWILLRWICFSFFTGIILGVISAAFSYCLRTGIAARTENPELIFLLPLGGLIIVGFYRLLDYANDGGTNLVLESIQSNKEIPLRMTPLIFISTVVTQIFGGSAGREGAALQIGGSVGNFLGKLFKLNATDKKVFIMSGMSAAFSALFGTPVAAAIFSMEVVSVGIMQYSALVPCTIASLTASAVGVRLGAAPERFNVTDVVDFSSETAMKTILLACLCAGISVVFCILMKSVNKFFKYFIENRYYRVILGSTLIIMFTVLLRTWDYSGTGMELIEKAIDGEVHKYAFIWKMLFTAVTLACGFKGGEIVPSFCIGATFGCLFGEVLGMSPSLCASIGMISLFCGVTNCPISSLLIALELFGMEAI
ncbi:MAG: chloride channel protein, partial [Clostridia bacterium]|nr:chloride channel protein [Clostridia bacterium]